MIDTAGAPKVIEFNVRFGDPETQPVMLRLQSDLLDLVEAAIDERLHETTAQWDPRPSLGVVMAAENYPGTPRTGDVINTIDAPDLDDTKVFHAGTRLEGEHVVTTGGRVLCVCALGDTVAEAQRQRLRRGRGHLLARRVPSPRHRLARDRARKGRVTPRASAQARFFRERRRGRRSAFQPPESEQCLQRMRAAFDQRAQQPRADHRVGDAVAAVGHREQHARPMLRMRAEERQAIGRLRERAGPQERRLRRELREQPLRPRQQPARLALHAPVATRRDVDGIVLAAHDQAVIVGAAAVEVRPRRFPDQQLGQAAPGHRAAADR